jgi:hypothetical protein
LHEARRQGDGQSNAAWHRGSPLTDRPAEPPDHVLRLWKGHLLEEMTMPGAVDGGLDRIWKEGRCRYHLLHTRRLRDHRSSDSAAMGSRS